MEWNFRKTRSGTKGDVRNNCVWEAVLPANVNVIVHCSLLRSERRKETNGKSNYINYAKFSSVAEATFEFGNTSAASDEIL